MWLSVKNLWKFVTSKRNRDYTAIDGYGKPLNDCALLACSVINQSTNC